jgi:hypothetical protein
VVVVGKELRSKEMRRKMLDGWSKDSWCLFADRGVVGRSRRNLEIGERSRRDLVIGVRILRYCSWRGGGYIWVLEPYVSNSPKHGRQIP